MSVLRSLPQTESAINCRASGGPPYCFRTPGCEEWPGPAPPTVPSPPVRASAVCLGVREANFD